MLRHRLTAFLTVRTTLVETEEVAWQDTDDQEAGRANERAFVTHRCQFVHARDAYNLCEEIHSEKDIR
jgi:hypothetical protein